MAADTTILQGEVNENPGLPDLNVERLLAGLLASLISEQQQGRGTERRPPPAPASGASA